MDNAILVSVCVITYNSGKFIQKTLDSIYAQTYMCLELIISDDCSTDATISLCQQWIEKHKGRFRSTQILAHNKNGGISKNINSAISAAKGEWVKPIAGDDLLLPNCISDNIEYIKQYDTEGVVCSKIHLFHEEGGNIVLSERIKPDADSARLFEKKAEEQYLHLMYYCFPSSPSVFYNRNLALSYPFQDVYSFCEDWPQWIQLTKSGIRLCFLDKETVLYRVDLGSVSHYNEKHFVNSKFHQSVISLFYKERYPVLIKIDPVTAKREKREFLAGEIAVKLLGNRVNFFTRCIMFLAKKTLGIRSIQ